VYSLHVIEYAYLCRDIYEEAVDEKTPFSPELQGGWTIEKSYNIYKDPTISEVLSQSLPDVDFCFHPGKHLEGGNENSSLKKIKKYKENHPLQSSFFARVYQRFSGEIVIVYRGTVPYYPGDDVADVKVLFRSESQHVASALKFYESLRGKKDSLGRFPAVTGHSLGGYLAQVVADVNPMISACVTFNAPQAGGLTVMTAQGPHYIDPRLPHSNIHNINERNDPVHHLGVTIGSEDDINPQGVIQLKSADHERRHYHFEAFEYFFRRRSHQKAPNFVKAHLIDQVITDLEQDDLKEKVF